MTDEYRTATTVDPETLLVELPLVIGLRWFDNLRSGIVGIVSLVPYEDGWTLTFAEAKSAAEVAAMHEPKEDDE